MTIIYIAVAAFVLVNCMAIVICCHCKSSSKGTKVYIEETEMTSTGKRVDGPRSKSVSSRQYQPRKAPPADVPTTDVPPFARGETLQLQADADYIAESNNTNNNP